MIKKLFKIAQQRITKNAINKLGNTNKPTVDKPTVDKPTAKKILVNTKSIVFDTKKIEENKGSVKN